MHGSGVTLGIIILLGFLPAQAGGLSHKSRQEMGSVPIDRLEIVEDFQLCMQSSKTDAEREALIDRLRVSMEGLPSVVAPADERNVDLDELLIRMNVAERNDRNSALIDRLKRVLLEQKENSQFLDDINKSKGQDRQCLIDEFRSIQDFRRKADEAKMFESLGDLRSAETSGVASSSSEINRRLSELDQAQREYVRVFEAVEENDAPKQKARLIEDWRAKAELEIAGRENEAKRRGQP